MNTMITQSYVNNVAYEVIGCAIEVHKHLGPGLLESVYHKCLIDELVENDLEVASQVWVPLYYKGKDLGSKLKLDILVENIIVVEIKAVELLAQVHKAQLLSYLRLTGKPKGLLINFHCQNITKQAVHLVTDKFSQLPVKAIRP